MSASSKHNRLNLIRRHYLETPEGVSDIDMIRYVYAQTGERITRRQVYNYRTQDLAPQIVSPSYGKYTLRPSAADVALAKITLKAARAAGMSV